MPDKHEVPAPRAHQKRWQKLYIGFGSVCEGHAVPILVPNQLGYKHSFQYTANVLFDAPLLPQAEERNRQELRSAKQHQFISKQIVWL